MRSIHTATLLAVAVMATAASASEKISATLVRSPRSAPGNRALATDKCDQGYQCDFFYLDKNAKKTYLFNLNGLCSDTQDYQIDVKTKTTNGLFKFNVCGQASSLCLPYTDPQMPYHYGVAVQYWGGDVPTGKKCFLQGSPHPCTRQCEVLGRGQPVFSVLHENNPTTGGLELRHYSEVTAETDVYRCLDQQEGHYVGRSVTYKIYCDEKEPLLSVINAFEHPICQYTIEMKSKHACGSVWEGTTSGADDAKLTSGNGHGGLAAGMFFLGLLLFAIGTAAFWFFRHKKSSQYSQFGGHGQTTNTENSGSKWTGSSTYQTDTGGIGSGI